MTEPQPLVHWEERGGGFWWVTITTTAGLIYRGLIRCDNADTLKPHK